MEKVLYFELFDTVYKDTNTVRKIKLNRLRWIGHIINRSGTFRH